MPNQNRLVVISGLSGSGKSVALHVLEDLGFYCIDNLPAALLKSLTQELMSSESVADSRVAVGVDARNPQGSLDALPGLLMALQEDGIQTELIYLQSDDEVLMKRYAESRRRHPLADDGSALHQAIDRERELLAPVINSADLVIDTTQTSIYELGKLIRDRVDSRHSTKLSVLIESFGFKHGIPADADFVFDLRCLPNPYWEPTLRAFNGKDTQVQEFLDQQTLFGEMYEDILGFMTRWIPEYQTLDRNYLTIAIGCTGGQHRSVYMTEKLAAALRKSHDTVLIRHSELP